MIGQWLALLNAEQEDRVLMRPMAPWVCCTPMVGAGCLVENVGDVDPSFGTPELRMYRAPFPGAVIESPNGRGSRGVGQEYDNLCERFGTERVNAAIRGRILRNRLRRALASRPQALVPSGEVQLISLGEGK